MKYSAAAAAAFVAGASASYGPGWAASAPAPSSSWVTEVMTAYTTYCPSATVISHGGSTYSVSKATTLTITGPVTVSYPVTISTTLACHECSKPPMTTAPAPPVYTVPHNATTVKPSGTGSVTKPSAPVYTGAAAALKAGSAGLVAVFGLVAYAL